MRIVATLLSSLAALAVSGGALAQGATASQVVEGATAADIIGFFQSVNFSARDVTKPGAMNGADAIRNIEVSPGEGSVFYVALRGCESTAPTARCNLIQPYTLFGSLNFPLVRVNAFNRTTSSISTMMLFDDGQLVLGAKFILVGGVAKQNLFTNLSVYVADINRAVEAIQNGGSSGSTVSYSPTDGVDGRSFVTLAPGESKVNWVGKATRTIDPEMIEALHHASQTQ